HGAVDGRQMRQLNFFQVIDSDWIVVALARQNNFNKIGYDAKLLEFGRSVLRMRWQGLVRRSLRLPSRDVIPAPNTFSDFRNGKLIETAAHVAAGVAVL